MTEHSNSNSNLSEPESFEIGLRELETLVSKIERGELPLEESMAMYERASFLSQWCVVQLKESEKRIQKLVKNREGKLDTTDFEGVIT